MWHKYITTYEQISKYVSEVKERVQILCLVHASTLYHRLFFRPTLEFIFAFLHVNSIRNTFIKRT